MNCCLQTQVISVTAALVCLVGCAEDRKDSAPASAPTAAVISIAETSAVATADADAADDPAIWAAPVGSTALLEREQVRGFIAGTDKKAGLYIFGLDGRQLQFLPDGLLNNVDLRPNVVVYGRPQVVLAASDRGRMGIALYRFDPGSKAADNRVLPLGFIKSDIAEPYGLCLGRLGQELHAILIGKDGTAQQFRVDTAASVRGTLVRSFKVGSQAEGCAVDDRASQLYVGEETKGVWRYRLSEDAGDERVMVQAVGGDGRLVADVEGVTLLRDGGATYLIVSSQGDSAFAVWEVSGAQPRYVGRFRISGTKGVDAVTGTDGIDALAGMVGPYPEGLVVVQDDDNDGLAQNFKLVDWREIRKTFVTKPQ